MFLLNPKSTDLEIPRVSYTSGAETGLDQRYRVNVFGDMESVEHAKTRVLMMVDQIVCRQTPLSSTN